jgi:arylsulfatase A-like enzyme/Flp pilus assembly protein TadD
MPRTDSEARAILSRRRPAPGDLNVLVITLDGLRADRLGCYGFAGTTSPHIDALARDGLLFERAFATAPLTLPSHASLFTGLIPPRHGVRDSGGFPLDDSRTALAERMQAAGYATGAFVGAWVLESRQGLGQGFDIYADEFVLGKLEISRGALRKRGDEVMDEALAWLETVRGRRFFAWVHLADPSAPHDPPEPQRSRHPGDLYLDEVAYADDVVGRLLEWLKQRGLEDRTLVVLTAGHGESLGEHGEAAHGYFIYGATTRVPLVVRTPWGDRAARSAAVVSSVDVFPTILDLVGLRPQQGIDGRSLIRAFVDPRADVARAAYVETCYPRFHFGWQHLRGLRNGRHLFVEAPEPELYDLEKDPGERVNVYAAFQQAAEELRATLRAMAGDGAEAGPRRQKLDPETLQRLGALDYLGSASAIDPRAELPDPKRKLHLFQLLSEAKRSAAGGMRDEAIARVRQVLAEEPGLADARLALGTWLAESGRSDEAIVEFEQLTAPHQGSEIATTRLADIHRARGAFEAAIEVYRRALAADRRNGHAWYHLAALLLDLGRAAEAEEAFRQALGSDPRMGAAYNGLAVIAFSRRTVVEAERLVRKGLELEARVRSGRYNLGRILEEKGDVAAAETLYRQELATYPNYGKARFALAQFLGKRGDRDGYLKELRAGIEKAPEFSPCYFLLAREELTAGNVDVAADLANRGLEVDPRSDAAHLGHYVLADVYNRRGERAKAAAAVASARRLEASLKRSGGPRL